MIELPTILLVQALATTHPYAAPVALPPLTEPGSAAAVDTVDDGGAILARAVQQADTVRTAVVITPWHERRLRVHRWTAYTIPPLFLYQYAVGRQLVEGVSSAEGEASWVRPAHRTGAILIGSAFAVNAVTGSWNLWAERHEPEHRIVRAVHGVSMLGALGGFTYAGLHLSREARSSADKRRQHQRVALASMATTVASGAMMWVVNRQ